LRDLFLWNAVVSMPERDRDVVRRGLVRKREAAFAPPQPWTDLARPSTAAAPSIPAQTAAPRAPSRPPVKKTPRVSDARKDWAREHGPIHTDLMKGLLTPIPPFRLYP
jgi:hypothetical protein